MTPWCKCQFRFCLLLLGPRRTRPTRLRFGRVADIWTGLGTRFHRNAIHMTCPSLYELGDTCVQHLAHDVPIFQIAVYTSTLQIWNHCKAFTGRQLRGDNYFMSSPFYLVSTDPRDGIRRYQSHWHAVRTAATLSQGSLFAAFLREWSCNTHPPGTLLHIGLEGRCSQVKISAGHSFMPFGNWILPTQAYAPRTVNQYCDSTN